MMYSAGRNGVDLPRRRRTGNEYKGKPPSTRQGVCPFSEVRGGWEHYCRSGSVSDGAAGP